VTFILLGQMTGYAYAAPAWRGESPIAWCIPRAVGVPGMPGPPDWWTSADAPRDDPRWRGAGQRSWEGGMEPQARLRALHADEGETRYLYFAFDVNFDPTLDVDTDGLVITLRPTFSGSDDDEYALVIYPIANQDEKTAQPVAAREFYTRTVDASTWTTAPEPPWLDAFARHWVESSGTAVHNWTVQLRIPITGPDSLQIGTDLDMYAALVVNTPGGNIQHHWPREVPDITGSFGSLNIPNGVPAASTWGRIRTEAFTPSEETCTAGVSLAWNQVGTTNPDPHTINLDSANTFFAAPRNNTSAEIPAGTLSARFRLANWGAAVPSDQWREIATGTSTSAIPAESDTPAGALQAAYTVPADERDFFAAHPHQCILVELTASIDLDFANDSVVRNMDFVEASTFTRTAEISTFGLGSPPGGSSEHDLWIFIEERNLAPATWQNRIRQSFTALTGLGRSPQGRESQAGDELVGWDFGWETSGVEPDRLSREQAWPTYRVHVYRETGEFLEIGGEPQPNLRLVGSYGYYLRHAGSLAGWETVFQGAQEVSPHLYRLTLGENSVAQVSNTIVAEEANPLWAGGILLLLLLLILLLVFLVRRRRGVPA